MSTKNTAKKMKVPMRKCIGCQEMKSKKDMMRILKTTEEEIILDTTGKKNGRGAYLCFSKECFEKAENNKGLERSLKTAIPKEVYEALKKELDTIEQK
ncbi:YlxR family protein [Ruminococcus gauvreauii]|uniref:YlxR family protein n=2 Tax=Ruminococcus gauvreauii TaxID=438033 RepID=A0ABY5VID7_9FIRM|nr:YlxR family protein [Ruminococcus gauvreauii]UWP59953.1 YlxR family protein [Ruminococcus gauvreauii]